MKLQKILALCLANLALFSSVAFANPPDISKYVKFGKYFITECEETKKLKDKEGKNWVQNADTRSDIFDKINQKKYTNVLEEQKLRAERQNKYHDCNCRFASAAIAEKLTELGIENYELLVLLPPTRKYHLANLYKYYDGTWVVADFFSSVNTGIYKTLSLKEYLWNVFTNGTDAIACYVKNKPLENFATRFDQGLINIRLFSDIYKNLLGDDSIEKILIRRGFDSIFDRILDEKSLYYQEGQQFTQTITNALKISHEFRSLDQKKTTNPIQSLRNKLKQISKDHSLNLNDGQIERYILECRHNPALQSLFM